MPIDPKLLKNAVPDEVFHEEELKDPVFRAGYEALGPRYDLIDAVLTARKARGWRQSDLAKACGTSQSSIARFESGDHDPRWTTVVMVCRALDLPLTLGKDTKLAG